MNEVLIRDAVALVRSSWRSQVQDGSRSGATETNYGSALERFIKFCDAYDAELIGQITSGLLTLWVNADGRDRSGILGAPNPATIRNRRLVVRAFFAELRALLGILTDPTDIVPQPARAEHERRPANQDEAEALLFFAGGADVGARGTTVALALSGLHSSEISLVRLSAVTRIDDSTGTVDAPGSRRILARTINVSGQCWRVIDHRAQWLRAENPDVDPDEILLSRLGRASELLATAHETPHVHQSAIGMQLRHVLDLAGLSQADGIRPESLPAYAGRVAFEASGKIEDAARLLGLKSLDHAAKIIGFDWTDTDATSGGAA